jgi:3-mercaptopyruvate sulfurtransferase SseA
MRLLFSLTAAVLLAALALAACNSSESNSNKANGNRVSNSPPAATPAPVAPSDGVKRVTTVETRDAVEKGAAIIVDVRAEASYKQNRIKGSISIPLEQVQTRISELPRDKMIVTYCS